jgi:hypothetical protein
MGRVTEIAPAGLVPAAWLLTATAHTSIASNRTLFIGMIVMDAALLLFAVASIGEMTGPVLTAWQGVIVAGLLMTVLGTVDMAISPDANPALPVTLYAWMLLPAVAYLYTGRETTQKPNQQVYLGAAVLSIVGAGIYSVPFIDILGGDAVMLTGIAVLGVGQTAGIVVAALQNAGTREGGPGPFI